jgi:nitrogen fixation protein FixH
MRAATMKSPDTSGQLTGRHVLLITLAFFGIVFAVNAYFLYAALSTHTGIVANEPYRKGLAYNSRIAADERQSELHWADATTIAADGTVTVDLTGQSGSKPQGLVVTGIISRPATAGFDRPLRFTETAPGHYTSEAGAIESGNWLVTIEARSSASDKDPAYRARRRLWLKP